VPEIVLACCCLIHGALLLTHAMSLRISRSRSFIPTSSGGKVDVLWQCSASTQGTTEVVAFRGLLIAGDMSITNFSDEGRGLAYCHMSYKVLS
jgi:hypothetical protein